jgi:hypothetical protein
MTSKGSEVENLVANYKCGRNFEPNDIKGMADFIVEVAGNKELNNLMRLNSSTAAQDFSSINVAKFLATTSLD